VFVGLTFGCNCNYRKPCSTGQWAPSAIINDVSDPPGGPAAPTAVDPQAPPTDAPATPLVPPPPDSPTTPAGSPGSAASPAPPDPARDPLRSVYTTNLAGIFNQLGISLVVSTYQAGKVILVRNDGGAINTHFRTFDKPMGIAADPQRLALGSARSVWTLRNMPALARKLDPPGKYDACYLPRDVHVTGDIDVHEMAYDQGNTLWIVNTRFCCLCTLDIDHSFTPRWRPPFVTAYAPEDRCHLNGLAMVDGRPKYVTALGTTDTPGGWRGNKARGGVLMDVESNDILLRGLSMPHSPRWYQDKLYFLESGEGSLARYDFKLRTWITLVHLPGFTRGIDFWGPLAFIGLSQVRESAVFSGIPLVERLAERTCGVWVVDLRTSQVVGFLRFEEGVQEIFAVQVLPNIRFPEILEFNDEKLAHAYVLPDAALAEVPPERREPASAGPVPAAPDTPPGEVDPFAAAYNRGIALRDRDDFEGAIAAFQEALAIRADNADAWNDLANAHAALNRLGEAIACYERAVAIRPEFPVAHMNMGMILMRTGELPRGLAEFEWRWKTPGFVPFLCPQPQWAGEDIAGKKLLVHTEQGAGDAIQFIRFLPQIARRAARVVLVAPEPLLGLFASAEGFHELRPAGEIPAGAFDVFTPLMSAPRHLGLTMDAIPSDVPYLRPPADHPLRLEAPTDRPVKVGLVWAGSASQGNDRNRSTNLETLGPILDVPGVTFYSLQVGPRAADVQRLAAPRQVHDLGGDLGDWADTAAAVAQLDLVIGVDTGVIHLAGALGKPVWVLLCHSPDYRWLENRPDSPWYPTMRLFWQPAPKDWAPVVAQAAEALEARARAGFRRAAPRAG